MKTKKLIGLLLLIVTLGFTTDSYYTITAGIGLDKLQVGQKIKSAFSILGKNDEFTEGIIDGSNFTIHINRYIYTKLGVTIITHVYEPKGEDLENAIIDNLVFDNPASAKTLDNVVLGKDSKEKVIYTYGIPDSDKDIYSNVTYFHYRKKGISFGIDDKTNKISTIEVYKKNGNPDNH
jgi:hypothetical protein